MKARATMTVQELQRKSLAILEEAFKSLRRETVVPRPARPAGVPAGLLLNAA